MCPAGYEKATTSSTSSLVQQRCNACSGGKYRTENSPDACKNCAANQAAPVGSSFCTTCLSGSKPNSDRTLCKCIPGYKKVGETCEICPAGKYTDVDDLDSCKTCAAGSYTDTLSASGATSCKECEQGKYDADSDSRSACLACPSGSITNVLTGATTCTKCDPGKLSTSNTVLSLIHI